MQNLAALLPTGTKMNPARPDSAEYFDAGQTAIVVRNLDSGTLRVFTTFGQVGNAWAIGTRHEVKHDQTGRYLGEFQVIGTVEFAGIRITQGEVPNRSLPHWVFK
jgi:hypothetical protein